MARYISGVLYGRAPDPMVDAVEDNDHGDTLAHGIEEADADTPVSMANVRYPSAMAISFGIDADAVSTLQIHVTGGMYTLTSDGDGAGQWERTAVSMVEEYEGSPLGRGHDKRPRAWTPAVREGAACRSGWRCCDHRGAGQHP